jgi:hypothetical protein
MKKANTTKKYNLSKIMKRAWELKRSYVDAIFSECLKEAWLEAKEGKFIAGTTYRAYIGERTERYVVEKVTNKTIVVTFFKGCRYEETRRCKIIDNGRTQVAFFKGIYLESSNEKVA